MVVMTFFQLNQRDWDTLKIELGKSFDVERNYTYQSPEKSKKSKRPLISSDYKILLMWKKLGETIGTWEIWTRTDSVANTFRNSQTGVAASDHKYHCMTMPQKPSMSPH